MSDGGTITSSAEAVVTTSQPERVELRRPCGRGSVALRRGDLLADADAANLGQSPL
jgi:hypothetical protein